MVQPTVHVSKIKVYERSKLVLNLGPVQQPVKMCVKNINTNIIPNYENSYITWNVCGRVQMSPITWQPGRVIVHYRPKYRNAFTTTCQSNLQLSVALII